MRLKMSDEMPARSTLPPAVTISPLGHEAAACDEVIAVLITASQDPEIHLKNYLPADMDAARARRYCLDTEGVVLRLDGRPVGVAVALPHPDPGQGVEIPAGCPELDMWVLHSHRGQGMRWFPLVKEFLAQRFDKVLGVTWEDNHTAVALLRWSGWQWLGRSFWSDGNSSGHCQVFVYDLAAYRSTRK